jgi:sec-independent protein translocase protein TatA
LYDSIGFIESPVQILIVLTIALLVFGPKKLPEIGRQIGGALRELRKAAGEVSRSFSTDYEPDTTSYDSSSSYDRTASYYTPPPAIDAPLDLTDYSIVGVTAPADEPPATSTPEAATDPRDLADYTLLGSLVPQAGAEPNVSEPRSDKVSSN